MKCPICGYTESKVIDSRPSAEGSSIRRRRECLSCQNRFTTYEKIETLPLLVVKKDKTRELFDKNKLLSGIIKACHKRPVTMEQMEEVASDIEAELQKDYSLIVLDYSFNNRFFHIAIINFTFFSIIYKINPKIWIIFIFIRINQFFN